MQVKNVQFFLKKLTPILEKKCTFLADIVRTSCGHRAYFVV